MEININEKWKEILPNSHFGLLVVEGIDNTKRETPLDQQKELVVSSLREKFKGYTRKDLLEIDTLKAYKDYYKKFDKTYHVQLQLESVVSKGKSLPNVSPLVDSNFAAELETMILTAGHDLDQIKLPVTLDITDGTEEFIQMNGNKKALKANDMMMRDSEGVICTIIYGQDQRTPITPKTKNALYVCYAPPGVAVEAVEQQLEKIKSNILLFTDNAQFSLQEIVSAN